MNIDRHKKVLAGLFGVQAIWQILIIIILSIFWGIYTLLLIFGGGFGEGPPLPAATPQELSNRLPIIIFVWILIGLFLLFPVLNIRISKKLAGNHSSIRILGIIISLLPILSTLIAIPALFYSFQKLKLVHSISTDDFNFYLMIFIFSCVLLAISFFGAIVGIYGLWVFLFKNEELQKIDNKISLSSPQLP